MLPEVPEIYAHWRSLMETIEVRRRQVYDVHLVAVMRAHNITPLLTFNASHFHLFHGANQLT